MDKVKEFILGIVNLEVPYKRDGIDLKVKAAVESGDESSLKIVIPIIIEGDKIEATRYIQVTPESLVKLKESIAVIEERLNKATINEGYFIEDDSRYPFFMEIRVLTLNKKIARQLTRVDEISKPIWQRIESKEIKTLGWAWSAEIWWTMEYPKVVLCEFGPEDYRWVEYHPLLKLEDIKQIIIK